jgi:hypothetical protein
MYNRQQNDVIEELGELTVNPQIEAYIQELLQNPIIQEQVYLPIIQLVIALRRGRTQKVAIRTQDKFYISALDDGNVVASTTSIGPNETFILVPQGVYRDRVAIQTSKGYYLSAMDGGGKRIVTSTTIGPNEQFIMVPINPNQAIFVTNIGFFLIPLITEPRFVTAYAIAADMRNIFTIIPLQ